ERKHDLVSYRLDRIGIPLVEIATDVSIKDGLHAREVAEKIGLLFRSTGKVQRGIGTIRQDLNVSVAGGARVEIKGAQELSDLKDLVDGEAKRQENLVALRAELKKKGVKFGEFAFVDLTGIFKRTKHTILARQIASRGVVFGLRLPGLAGFLGRELLPNHRFGTELAGYAKAVAGVGGILHSDEEAKFRFSSEELLALEKELSCRKSDAWVLVASGKDRALSALKVVFDRAKLVLKEVPKETRQARGVVSVYLRPLPGGARMYPETDLPRVVIARERIELLENNLPLSLEEKEGKLVDLGLSRELAGRMARSSQLALFEELLASKAEPSFVAGVLLESFTSLRRKGVNVEGVSRESLRELFDFFAKGVIAKAGVEDALVGLAKGHSLRHVVELKGLRKLSVKELKSEVAELKKKGVDEKRLFSEAMRLFRTRADAGDVKEALGMKKGFI
ncbi:MAG: Glu-tRNA(Gln) amidotransferase subunit GatE, partial [Candidatus Micrarchaeia archaeon]